MKELASRFLIVLAACLALGTVAVGCGDDDDGDDTVDAGDGGKTDGGKAGTGGPKAGSGGKGGSGAAGDGGQAGSDAGPEDDASVSEMVTIVANVKVRLRRRLVAISLTT